MDCCRKGKAMGLCGVDNIRSGSTHGCVTSIDVSHQVLDHVITNPNPNPNPNPNLTHKVKDHNITLFLLCNIVRDFCHGLVETAVTVS